MRRIAIVSFSPAGGRLAARVGQLSAEELWGEQAEVEIYALKKYAGELGQQPVEPGLSAWCGRLWNTVDGILFIGASGIAVRTIAPYVKSKVTDPAVLVMDEAGSFVISLLSGHLGGANAWAVSLAKALEAVPVVTTATDVEHRFAVDVWAKANGLAISSMKLAKEVSADILQGRCIYFGSEAVWEGELPEDLTEWKGEKFPDCKRGESGELIEAELPVLIWCGLSMPAGYPANRVLWLIPRCMCLGAGCRKDKEYEVIRRRAETVLSAAGIPQAAIGSIASIDLKKEEAGLIRLAEAWRIPFRTYTSEELLSVEGDFTPSTFVHSITGVDNVCERAAMADHGKYLRIRKQAGDGVTIAVSEKSWRIRF